MTPLSTIQAVVEIHVLLHQDAVKILRQPQVSEGIMPFLLKSFHQVSWRFNHSVLWEYKMTN